MFVFTFSLVINIYNIILSFNIYRKTQKGSLVNWHISDISVNATGAFKCSYYSVDYACFK